MLVKHFPHSILHFRVIRIKVEHITNHTSKALIGKCLGSKTKILCNKTSRHHSTQHPQESPTYHNQAPADQRLDNAIEPVNLVIIPCLSSHQAPFVQRLDSTIHSIHLESSYPMDSGLSNVDGAIHPLNNRDRGPVSRKSRELFRPGKQVVINCNPLVFKS